MKIVTRLAPSPTGDFFHLGNLRTMLYNYFLAKKNGGEFIVRLEDTDKDRYNPKFLKHFRDTCDWLNIQPDYSYWNPKPGIGSFIQSERDYTSKIKHLLDTKQAYYAFDTKEELEALRNAGLKYDADTRSNMNNSINMNESDLKEALKGMYVVRFLVNPNVDISFTDEVLGEITINTNTLDDKVLLKSNGIGSYHLCNVCDDHDMGVTHVLRGNEWVNSTPFHILLYKAFGWELPKFAHLPLIMNPDSGKLSKRSASKYGIPISPLGYEDADGNYQKGWKDHGFDPKSIINTIALLGWNPGNDVELMSVQEMIDSFSLDRVNKAGAKFDMVKAKWVNSQHLKRTNNDCLRAIMTFKDDRYSYEKEDMLIDLAKNRSEFRKEMVEILDLFYDDNLIKHDVDDVNKKVLNKFVDHLSLIDTDDTDSSKNTLFNICKEEGIKFGKIMPTLRLILVNGLPGPDLMTTIKILGKDETIKRIKNSI